MFYLAEFLFFPVAYPIAKLLDCILGGEEGITVHNTPF